MDMINRVSGGGGDQKYCEGIIRNSREMMLDVK
jgi:hypothetical protein